MIPHETERPLPARVVPLSGESLVSLWRRTTATMGYESPGRIRSLLSDTGDVPTHLNLLSPGLAVDRMARLLRLSTTDVVERTFHQFAAALVPVPPDSPCPMVCDSKTVLRYFVTYASPICPRCLQEDSFAYERLVWSFRAVPVCVSHQCLLITRCPACSRLLRGDRQDVSRCPCGFLLTEAIGQPVPPQAIELAGVLEQLLRDRAILLPGMPAAATFWWAERLAAAAAKTPVWLQGFARRLGFLPGQESEVLAWLAAAEILTHWPDRLGEFLNAFQQVAKHRNTSTGISRRFGLLLREAKWLEQIGYPQPANALRDYLLRHYAAGHLSGKVCLFQGSQHRALLGQRSWITQTEAAGYLQIRQGAIAALVARGVLIGQIHSAGKQGRSVGLVLRESVESLASELRQSLDVRTTASRLGIGRHAVLDLIRAGLLDRAVRTARGWRVSQPSVAVWENFCAGLPRIQGKTADWVSLRQAARIAGPSGLTMSELLKLIKTGFLKARMAKPQDGLHGIALSCADLESVRQATRNHREPLSDWSLHRVANNLFPTRPVKPYVLKKWIQAGLLEARQEGSRTMISAAEIQRFRAEYCLTQEALQIVGITRSTLSRWEAQGRITPVYGKRVTPRAGFSLYRRQDLQGLVKAAS